MSDKSDVTVYIYIYIIYIYIYIYIYIIYNIIYIYIYYIYISIPVCERSKEKLGMYGTYHPSNNYQVLIESIWC